MVIDDQKMNVNHITSNIGCVVKSALLQAKADSRLIVGFSESINTLSKIPDGSLFCLLAEPKQGDSATHMHEVLLEAFCYENDIYVIKVDSAEKLSRILGTKITVSCVLIQKALTATATTTTTITTTTTSSKEHNEDNLNNMENTMVDHCEYYWDTPRQPIIQLPAV